MILYESNDRNDIVINLKFFHGKNHHLVHFWRTTYVNFFCLIFDHVVTDEYFIESLLYVRNHWIHSLIRVSDGHIEQI